LAHNWMDTVVIPFKIGVHFLIFLIFNFSDKLRVIYFHIHLHLFPLPLVLMRT